MMVTIQQVFRPLFVLSFIVGLRFYSIKQSKSKYQWIGYLYILYFSTVWFTYSFFFYYMLIKFYEIKGVAIILGMGVLTTLTSAILSLYHQKV
jgi:hypothetical protein